MAGVLKAREKDFQTGKQARLPPPAPQTGGSGIARPPRRSSIEAAALRPYPPFPDKFALAAALFPVGAARRHQGLIDDRVQVQRGVEALS